MFSIYWPTEMIDSPLFCCSFLKTWLNMSLLKIDNQAGRQLAVGGISFKAVELNNERKMSAF